MTGHSFAALIGLLACIILECSALLSGNSESDLTYSSQICQTEKSRVQQAEMDNQYLQPFGHWTSKSCEIHRGPTFMLRSYRVMETKGFSLHRYHYSDEDCSAPSHAVVAEGRLFFKGETLTVPGAREFDYELRSVDLIPYTEDALEDIKRILGNSSCWKTKIADQEPQPFSISTLSTHEPIRVFDKIPSAYRYSKPWIVYGHARSQTETIDCLWDFGLSFLDLTLMRLSQTSLDQNRVLRTGKVRFDKQLGAFERPSSFAAEMVDSYEVTDCPICKRIRNSNSLSPPRLNRQTRHLIDGPRSLNSDLAGHWFSKGCESEPNGYYVLRQLWLQTRRQKWKLTKSYYDHATCRLPAFEISTRGKYIIGPDMAHLRDSYYILNKIKKVKFVPKQAQYTNICELEGRPRRRNLMKLMDPSNPCIMVQTKSEMRMFPSIFKISGSKKSPELLLGDYNSRKDDSFPTSFLAPLIKCEEQVVIIGITTNFSHNDLYNTRYAMGLQSSGSSHFYSRGFWVIMLTFMVSVALSTKL